jgi:hypothetical protein
MSLCDWFPLFLDRVVVFSVEFECPLKNWTLADDTTMLGTYQMTQRHIPEEHRP